MQRVSTLLPSFSWDKTKTGSKKSFDKVWGWADKLGAPVNRLSNRIGSEAFWPMTLDKESDKAARILRSFCKDGFYTEEDSPTSRQKVLKKVPQKVMQNAVGLAIFTTMRAGLWVSGAGGSGVLIARKEDGTWSPPSGILLHTAGLGFLVGVDIYDCVLVINNRDALRAFTKIRATLGGEISAVAGPVGMGGILEHDGRWKQANKPVFTYLKSRGFYAGVQVDGTIVIERTDENERFYGQKISAADILADKVNRLPHGIEMLMETVKAAEGREDVNQDMMDELAAQPAPGDVDVESPTRLRRDSSGPLFGIPEPEDPDPFGVLALQKAGMEIREAGTKSRPPSSQFEYRPSPTSPVYPFFHRLSIDTFRTSNRGSYMSSRTRASTDRTMHTAEMGTQTDDDLATPATSPSLSNFGGYIIEEEIVKSPADIDYTKIDLGPYNNIDHNGSLDFRGSEISAMDADHEHDIASQIRPRDLCLPESDAETNYDTDDDDSRHGDDEPVVFEIAAAQSTRSAVIMPKANVVKVKGSLVDIPRRIPPALPPRSPMRVGRTTHQASGRSITPSPTKDGFEEVPLGGPMRVASEFDLHPGIESVLDGSDGITMQDEEAQSGTVQSIMKDLSTRIHAPPAEASADDTHLDAKSNDVENGKPSLQPPEETLKPEQDTAGEHYPSNHNLIPTTSSNGRDSNDFYSLSMAPIATH